MARVVNLYDALREYRYANDAVNGAQFILADAQYELSRRERERVDAERRVRDALVAVGDEDVAGVIFPTPTRRRRWWHRGGNR